MPRAHNSVDLASFYNRISYQAEGRKVLSKEDPSARPLYIITGASFTAYDPAKHGTEPTHAFFPGDTQDGHQIYLMNNGAAAAVKLLQAGENVLIHGRDSLALKTALNGHIANPNIKIIGGDLSEEQDAARLFSAIADFGARKPLSEVRLMAYQSFAQSSGSPFKPMHIEAVGEVERAASRRIRFVYHMAALGYWLLDEQKQDQLRVVALSALAANRPSFGLMADTADKFMNESSWRTFHLEANHFTGRPVSVIQVNPGITTSGEVYRGDEMRRFLCEEAKADGFAMHPAIESGKADIPQLSAHQVGDVVYRMITANEGDDTNAGIDDNLKAALYGGYDPATLQAIFANAITTHEDGSIAIAAGREGPEHLYAPYTQYGSLPQVTPGQYQRISLTPPGQTF